MRLPKRARAPVSPLRLILLAYLVIASLYALALPFADLPDESAHYLYAEYLLQRRALPIFTSGSGNYEAHQPPLYYALAALIMGAAQRLGATRDLAGVAVRFLSVGFGALVVWLTYLVVRSVWPEQQALAELTPAVVAFLPSHLLVCAALGNDALAEVFFLGLLVGAGTFLPRGRPLAIFLGLGVWVGLGLLTKVSAVLLLPTAVVAVVAASSAWPPEERYRCLARGLLLLVGAAVLCTLWWLRRNQLLYGDLLGMHRFIEVFTRDRPGPAYFSRFGAGVYPQVVALWTFCSSLAVFGRADRFMPWPVYAVWFAFCLASVCGLLLWLFESQARKRARVASSQVRGSSAPLAIAQRTVLVTMLVQMLLVSAAFVRFNTVFFQAQARYLLPAIGAWAFFFALGLLRLFPERFRLLAARVLAMALAVAAVAFLLLWCLPGRGLAVPFVTPGAPT